MLIRGRIPRAIPRTRAFLAVILKNSVLDNELYSQCLLGTWSARIVPILDSCVKFPDKLASVDWFVAFSKNQLAPHWLGATALGAMGQQTSSNGRFKRGRGQLSGTEPPQSSWIAGNFRTWESKHPPIPIHVTAVSDTAIGPLQTTKFSPQRIQPRIRIGSRN